MSYFCEGGFPLNTALKERDVYDAIADPTRRKLIRLLADSEELPLYEITSHFDMGRTAVSKHLTILKQADLVKNRKIGRETRYRLNSAPLQEIQIVTIAYGDNHVEVAVTVIEGDEDKTVSLKANHEQFLIKEGATGNVQILEVTTIGDRIKGISFEKGFAYNTVLNGFAATVKAQDLEQLLEIKGVTLVEPDAIVHALTDDKPAIKPK